MKPNMPNGQMQMPSLRDIFMSTIANNPQAQNTVLFAQMMQAIQANDNQAGERLAMNICQQYGVTPQEAYQQALNYFMNNLRR